MVEAMDCARTEGSTNDIDSRTAITITNLPHNAAELNQPLENLTDIIVKDENPPKDETNNYLQLQYTWNEPVNLLNKTVKPEVGDLQANDFVIEKELRNSEEIFVKKGISETIIKQKFVENSSVVKVEECCDAPVKVEKDPDDIALISEEFTVKDEINEGIAIAIHKQATDINSDASIGRLSNKETAINFNAIKLCLSQKLKEMKPKLPQSELYSYPNTKVTSGKKCNFVAPQRDFFKNIRADREIYGKVASSRPKHNKETHFKCSLCPFETKWEASYRYHFTFLHNEGKPFKCNKCEFKTQKNYCLRRHLKTHLEYKFKPFPCNKCDYKAATKGNLKAHELLHHMSYKCKDCAYVASSKQYMQQHAKEQGHTDEFVEIYKCEECDFSSKMKWIAEWHSKIHNGLKTI